MFRLSGSAVGTMLTFSQITRDPKDSGMKKRAQPQQGSVLVVPQLYSIEVT